MASAEQIKPRKRMIYKERTSVKEGMESIKNLLKRPVRIASDKAILGK